MSVVLFGHFGAEQIVELRMAEEEGYDFDSNLLIDNESSSPNSEIPFSILVVMPSPISKSK